MGFLDDLLPGKTKKAKVTKPPEAVERSKRPPPNATRARPLTTSSSTQKDSPSSTTFFGSLRRLKGTTASSTPRNDKPVNRRIDNNANFTNENVGAPPRTNISKVKSLHGLARTQPPKPSQNYSRPKPKRPVTVAVPDNVTVRRGHKEGQNHPDNISRTSSITNLDSLEAGIPPAKGAKPRKASSKEKIDKQAQDGRKVTKNNNKLETPLPQPLSYSTDSLQDNELQQLKKQLKEMANEKSTLALQLGEQRGQLTVLQNEILKLKTFQEESNMEMEKLAEENTVLRNRLRDVAHSPLSDNEKQQLLFESRHHSSAPASIATNVVEENGGDATACTTPDWDKHSSGNVSEVSVACLQDKINQMQETHYSTNEELQATLQELTDLQRQLTELQQENERLNDEKTLMFDSLCRQTERLNDSRQDVDNLKQLLYRERSDDSGLNQFESAVEREQKLVDLLQSAQEEREQLLLKLEQVQAELHEVRAGNADKTDAIAQLSERVKTLECTLDAKHAEHKQLDQELAQAKDQCSGKQIEIDRLSDLLENARTKINELEQDRALSDKSELDELLDNARKEKDQLESEISCLKEQLARGKNEIEKMKEQILVLQEECKVTRNNAKSTQSDLEYKCERIAAEKTALGEQLQQFQEAVNELQVQAQCHLEDKRQLSSVLSETQRNLSESERKNLNLENELRELKKLRSEEIDEWEKFQNDLLTSVRVANDFKTEIQQESQKIVLENKAYRERVRLLEGQLDKLKGDTEDTENTSTQTDIILTPQIVTIARNFDPTATNRLSHLERPTSPEGSAMEKFFPRLSKERRSKSKESLEAHSEDSKHKRNKSEGGPLKKSRSRDDLTKVTNVTEVTEAAAPAPSGMLKFAAKKSKSREDLTNQEGDKNPPKEKGSRGFLRWNKSKENLDQLDQPPPKEKKKFLTRNKSHESLSEEAPEPLKKREKKPPARAKHLNPKSMSTEEETLLKTLNDWYRNIDESLPDEFLTDEDRAVRKLKVLFEDDSLKERPVAHKPKENLAISKPLLDSVVLNPKLERIFKDPNLPTVDSEVRQSALEEALSEPDGAPQTNLPVLEEEPRYRTVSFNRMSTDILPTDSASNPTHSVRYHELPKPTVEVNYENLDEIVHGIPEGSNLTEEQKFAVRLKQALDGPEADKPKMNKKRSVRGQEISAPTRDSVEKNWKLREILLNPRIRAAQEPKEREWKRHSTDISSDIGYALNRHSVVMQSSKSHEDISFTFDSLERSRESGMEIAETEESSRSSRSFTSAEFNLDTGDVVLRQDDVNEDLLYNETINKTKKEKRESKQLIEKIIRDLAKQEEEEDEEIHHPKIIEAREKYKRELQSALRRLEQDELRSSCRKQRIKAVQLVEARQPVEEESVAVVEARREMFYPVPAQRTKLVKLMSNPDKEDRVIAEGVNYHVRQNSLVAEEVPPKKEADIERHPVILQDFSSPRLNPRVFTANIEENHHQVVPTENEVAMKKVYPVTLQDTSRQMFTGSRVPAEEQTLVIEERQSEPRNLEDVGEARHVILHADARPQDQLKSEVHRVVLRDVSGEYATEASLQSLVIEERQSEPRNLEDVGEARHVILHADSRPQDQLKSEVHRVVLRDVSGEYATEASLQSLVIEERQSEPQNPENVEETNSEIHRVILHEYSRTHSSEDRLKSEVYHAVLQEVSSEYAASTGKSSLQSLAIEESGPEPKNREDLEEDKLNAEVYQVVVQEDAPFTGFAAPADVPSLGSLTIEEVRPEPSPEELESQVNPRMYSLVGEQDAPFTGFAVSAGESSLHSLTIEEETRPETSPEDSEEGKLNPQVYSVVVREDALFTGFAVSAGESSLSSLTIEDKTELETSPEVLEEDSGSLQGMAPADSLAIEERQPKGQIPGVLEQTTNVCKPQMVSTNESSCRSLVTEDGPEHLEGHSINSRVIPLDTLKEDSEEVDEHERGKLHVIVEEVARYTSQPHESEVQNLVPSLPQRPDEDYMPPPPPGFVDESLEQAKLNNHHHYDTLKENQYGVASPAGIRYTYRNVVKEFKTIYPPEDDDSPTPGEDGEDAPGEDESETAFVEDFFKPVTFPSAQHQLEDDVMSRIDSEMEAIMEKYRLKLTEIPHREDSSESLQTAKVAVVIEEEPLAATAKEEQPEPLSIEDLRFIEEMKQKYAPASVDLNSKKSRPLSGINEQDLLLIERATKDLEEPPRLRHSPADRLPPSLRPRRPADLPLNRPKSYDYGALTSQESPQLRQDPYRSSARLSDLIFTETIFIPHSHRQSPDKPAPKSPSRSTETLFVAKQESPNTKSEAKTNRDKYAESPTNSWRNSLKKGLLDSPGTYEPVYAKPSPVPRAAGAAAATWEVTHLGASPKTPATLTTDMTDANKNFSDLNISKTENGSHGQSQEVILVEESKAHTNILENLNEGVEKPDKELQLDSAAPVSAEEDVEEVPREPSNVNLFHMDPASPTSPYDSYLDLFKSKENDGPGGSSAGQESVPKIVDFVPLDEKTTPVFTKPDNPPAYDTLEREKTFQVLGQAANLGAKKEEEPMMEKRSSDVSKSSSKGQSGTSRTSFTQAKKLFEALAEANKEEKPVKPLKAKGRDSKSSIPEDKKFT